MCLFLGYRERIGEGGEAYRDSVGLHEAKVLVQS